jgi:hypothetical protein
LLPFSPSANTCIIVDLFVLSYPLTTTSGLGWRHRRHEKGIMKSDTGNKQFNKPLALRSARSRLNKPSFPETETAHSEEAGS